MGKMVGYMLTWTTYGSWLQGDRRGYVKDGELLGENPKLWKANIESQGGKKVTLKEQERKIVRKAILNEAKKLGQKLYSLAVCSNHVHLVAGYISDPINEVVGYYKNTARAALQTNGFVGRVWTKGYDKRYCFDERSLKQRIDYFRRHK
ncbi:MAG: transposase [Planctomycetota bacterium]|jgi:REP element-mobilizing transposase RayT